MNRNYIKIIVALLSLTILFQVSAFAQTQKKVTVKDEGGNPIPGVIVTVGEGSRPILTDDKGEFDLKFEGSTSLLLEIKGYDTQMLTVTLLTDLSNLVMVKSPYQMTTGDKINLPFGTFMKRQIPAVITALDPDEILKSDHTSTIAGLINGRVPGFYGSSDNRGLGAPLVIVDGVPRPATDYNVQQIGQVTVLKDLLTSVMYGGQTNNGIIFITTKRGAPLKKMLNFTVESGLNKPISYPNFLSAGDYMGLYNEALANDGLTPKFSQSVIDGTTSGSNPVHYPDEDYYNSTYLKKYSSYSNVVVESSGGNDIAQYYLNLGWNRNTSMLKLGEGGNEKRDLLNVRGNVDYKLNDFIKIRFDAATIFKITNTPRFTSTTENFWTLSSTLHPENTPVLIPSSLMKDKALLGAAQLVDGQYLLGGTSQYRQNIYGELTRNGPTTINERLVEMNVGLDFDLGFLTEGLKASIFFSYDLQNVFRTDLLNTYAVYQPIYGTGVDTITSFNKINADVKVNNQTLSDVSFYRRVGLYGKIDYHRIFGEHELTINALTYRDQLSTEGLLQPLKHMNFGVRANYNYNKKFIAEVTGVMTGSTKLYESALWGFSPGAGLAWVLSEESFLKDNSLINFLKVRANWAMVQTDEGLANYNVGHDIYTAGAAYVYNHGLGSNNLMLLSLGNSNLGLERRMNFNLGFDGMLVNNKLAVEASYFYYKSSDVITQRTNYLPSYYGSLPYENYGQYQSQGVEFGLNYTQNFGGVTMSLGSNITYSVPKNLVVNELDYPYDYLRATGKPTDAMFGFVALGLFTDPTDISGSPVQTFGTVKPGDIKYQDLNGDNVINDLDQKMIGNSHSSVEYSFNLSLKYKAFELFALATGQTGSNVYFNSPYYWVFGDRKYSNVVLNRWTPETASTATYPRLTTLPSTNNFRNSTYWLYDNNWFTLQTLQLTYSLIGKVNGIKEARIFVRGNNLFTISQIKDKTQLNIGSAPQTRFMSLGITVML